MEPLTRRDFLNGVLIGAGAALAGCTPGTGRESGARPPEVLALPAAGPYQGSLAVDPRALRGGDHPSAFAIGHWLRDRRMQFETQNVVVSASASDAVVGRFPVADGGEADVIVVGSGLSGLSAAWFVRKERPQARVLLLDGNPHFGGNASCDAGPPLPVPASTAGAYFVEPFAAYLKELYDALDVRLDACRVPDPTYSYFFDERTPFANPGPGRWVIDTWGKGLDQVPYRSSVVKQLRAARADLRAWFKRPGSPTDPADASDPAHDALASMSFAAYLTNEKKLDRAVADFYSRYAVDSLGGPTDQVNAHAAISFLGAEYGEAFAFPGGNHGLARRLVRGLVPSGGVDVDNLAAPLDAARLDDARSGVRVRQGALAVRAHTTPQGARVTYHDQGRFHEARAKAVILAGQSHTARHLVDHLIDDATRHAFSEITHVPTVVANVAIRSARPLVERGLGYNQCWWGSKAFAGFVVADWVTAARGNADRPTVLTFYGGNEVGPEGLAAARMQLMSRPFADYEASLREDLARLFPTGFDFDRDVSAVFLYRWGHALVMPKLGYTFGAPRVTGGKVERTDAPRHVARRPLGRIAFAGQDLEGAPSVECAIASGLRASRDVLSFL